MLIRPTEEELKDSGELDYIAGQLPAKRFTKGVSSTTSVEIDFKHMERIILGGEMRRSVFSVILCVFFPSR